MGQILDYSTQKQLEDTYGLRFIPMEYFQTERVRVEAIVVGFEAYLAKVYQGCERFHYNYVTGKSVSSCVFNGMLQVTANPLWFSIGLSYNDLQVWVRDMSYDDIVTYLWSKITAIQYYTLNIASLNLTHSEIWRAEFPLWMCYNLQRFTYEAWEQQRSYLITRFPVPVTENPVPVNISSKGSNSGAVPSDITLNGDDD